MGIERGEGTVDDKGKVYNKKGEEGRESEDTN